MQYVGRAIGSVSKTWNSINPATLSGAIDVIVVEQENGMFIHTIYFIHHNNF
jgi:phosphatidate phosphatase LPIN